MASPTTKEMKNSMATTESTANGNKNPSNLPAWINEDNFQSILEENVEGFEKTLNFEVKETGGGGENYASVMSRVKAKVQLKDGSTKNVAFMIKTTPPGEQGAALVTMMGLFPKETAMYGKCLREFEEMYRSVGKKVSFGPKFYKLKNDPGVEYVILEDLSPRGFKNLNRLEGLDEEHTKSVLQMLAELHAVSAVRYEQKGDYEDSFMVSPFKEESRESLEKMLKPIIQIMKDSFAEHETGRKYLPTLQLLFNNLTDRYIDAGKRNRDDFNVMVHGDLWSNNITFRQNDEGKCGILFDEFIKFYHDNLLENLKLLKYPKKLPTLKQLRMDLLKYNFWGISTVTGIMSAVLLDPHENANIDNFFLESKEAIDFQKKMYINPRYIKHLDVVLPWMVKMGYLDEY